MLENTINKKLTVIILAVIFVVSLATTAFAADQAGSRQAVNGNKPTRMDFSKISETVKSFSFVSGK